MSDTDANGNWVDRRAKRERILNQGAPEIWRALVVAIESAVQSFQREYCDQAVGPSADFKSDNGSCTVKITRTVIPRFPIAASVDIRFDAAALKITARTVDPSRTVAPPEIKLHIEADDDGTVYLVHEGRRITHDEASELLLTAVLFPGNRATGGPKSNVIA